jgi:GNAT superfamily N-acetyltransferase
MEKITFHEEYPSPEEYIRLRKMAGWTIPDPAVIGPSLRNSPFCICARSRGRIVGMARVIGDGGMAYYIQDVIVEPSHQGKGIGKQLMDRTMEFLQRQTVENTIVGLMAAKGKEPFYERYGFRRRPNENFGAGMTIFWKTEKKGAEGENPFSRNR